MNPYRSPPLLTATPPDMCAQSSALPGEKPRLRQPRKRSAEEQFLSGTRHSSVEVPGALPAARSSFSSVASASASQLRGTSNRISSSACKSSQLALRRSSATNTSTPSPKPRTPPSPHSPRSEPDVDRPSHWALVLGKARLGWQASFDLHFSPVDN